MSDQQQASSPSPSTTKTPSSAKSAGFNCHYCGKYFTQIGGLTRHNHTAHNVVQFLCDFHVCGAKDVNGNVCNVLVQNSETVNGRIADGEVWDGSVGREAHVVHRFPPKRTAEWQTQPTTNEDMARVFPLKKWRTLAAKYPGELGDPAMKKASKLKYQQKLARDRAARKTSEGSKRPSQEVCTSSGQEGGEVAGAGIHSAMSFQAGQRYEASQLALPSEHTVRQEYTMVSSPPPGPARHDLSSIGFYSGMMNAPPSAESGFNQDDTFVDGNFFDIDSQPALPPEPPSHLQGPPSNPALDFGQFHADVSAGAEMPGVPSQQEMDQIPDYLWLPPGWQPPPSQEMTPPTPSLSYGDVALPSHQPDPAHGATPGRPRSAFGGESASSGMTTNAYPGTTTNANAYPGLDPGMTTNALTGLEYSDFWV